MAIDTRSHDQQRNRLRGPDLVALALSLSIGASFAPPALAVTPAPPPAGETPTVERGERQKAGPKRRFPRPRRVQHPSLAPGERGHSVRRLQYWLGRRGYATPRSGVYDSGTARAVLAFRKVNGFPLTGTAPKAVFRRLTHGGAFRLRHPRAGKAGKHVEVDLSRQVMALARGGRPVRTYHVSTGTPVTPTIRGRFSFYSRLPGYNAKGMYFSTFFIGGYAIHGYMSVPPFPASHGCVRVPIPSAISIYRWLNLGDPIYVYP